MEDREREIGETVSRCYIHIKACQPDSYVKIISQNPNSLARREASKLAVRQSQDLESMIREVSIPGVYRTKDALGPLDREEEKENILIHRLNLQHSQLMALLADHQLKNRQIEQMVEQIVLLHFNQMTAARSNASLRLDVSLLRSRSNEIAQDNIQLRRQLHDLIGQYKNTMREKKDIQEKDQRKEAELEAVEIESTRLKKLLKNVEQLVEKGTLPLLETIRFTPQKREGNEDAREKNWKTENDLKKERRLRVEAEENAWEIDQEMRRIQKDNIALMGRLSARERENDAFREEMEFLKSKPELPSDDQHSKTKPNYSSAQ
eukprot:Ihof_evm2s59 gene=Ihof_evmTU2s59